MIPVEEVESIHSKLISRFGGSNGIRDKEILLSALARPFQSFDGNDLYKTIHQKAAALIESLLINHPFVDGNKRTGYTLANLFLRQNGFSITASLENKYEFVINIASGAMKYEEIEKWLVENTAPTNGS